MKKNTDTDKKATNTSTKKTATPAKKTATPAKKTATSTKKSTSKSNNIAQFEIGDIVRIKPTVDVIFDNVDTALWLNVGSVGKTVDIKSVEDKGKHKGELIYEIEFSGDNSTFFFYGTDLEKADEKQLWYSNIANFIDNKIWSGTKDVAGSVKRKFGKKIAELKYEDVLDLFDWLGKYRDNLIAVCASLAIYNLKTSLDEVTKETIIDTLDELTVYQNVVLKLAGAYV